jgi:ABC-type microcin C transport system permease subunit YejB
VSTDGTWSSAIHGGADRDELRKMAQSEDEWRRWRRVVVLAIGPAGAYLIIAALLLIVLAGGTYVGYRINRGPASDRPDAMGSRHEGEEP